MKNYFLCLLMLIMYRVACAQNLVVNPSFEITNTNCSGFGGEGFRQDLDPSWDNANSNIPGDSCSSPDLFSACNPFATGMPDATMVGIGWQYSRTGTRHVGLIAYSAPFGIADNYREYIQGQTTTPLVAGQTYCVSFYVSLADGSPWAVRDLDVYFSNTRYLRNACTQGSRINVTPQLVNNCGVISDTMNWVRLQWDYVATGGEQYFIIGNFSTDAATTRAPASGSGFGNFFAYYFIDDVSIVENTCCYAEITPEVACISDAPFNLTASPGVGCVNPLSGTWSGPGITNASTGTFSPAVAGVGTHTITFTASCGYVATTNIIVSPCALQACVESDGSLTASGGATPYTWQSQTTVQDCSSCFVGCIIPPGCAVDVLQWTTFATGTNIPSPSGYPVQLTDAGGNTLIINSSSSLPACGADPCASTTITINVTPTHASCNAAGSAAASASGGTAPYAYSWNTIPVQTTATATNLPPGNYTVTTADANGCTGTASVTINPAPQGVTATATATDALCNGASSGTATVSVTGGTTPYTYSWSSGGITATINNLSAGTYTVLVTDAAGCTSQASVQVNEPPAIALSTSSMPSQCTTNDGTATVVVSGGTAPYTYSWSPSGGTGATTTPVGQGNYTVTVTDANGCQANATVVVGGVNAPALTVVTTQHVSCFGNADGSAEVSASGGAPPYTYSWLPSGGTGTTVSNLSAGTYTVTVTDDAGCTAQTQVVITQPGAVTVTENVVPATCGAADGEISLTVSGGTGGYTFAWTPNVSTTNTAGGLSVGTYDIVVTDASGCSSTVSVEVEIGTTFYMEATPETALIDLGGSIGLTIDVAPGVTVDNITWSPPDGLSCTDCPDPMASPLVTTTYIVAVTSDDGCVAYDTVTIIVKQPCGELFVPTIFSPNGDGLNDFECVMGDCIVDLDFTIYNRWGEVVFTSDNQSDCWDGTFRGKPVQTGVYVYKLEARLNTGETISQSGNINVTR